MTPDRLLQDFGPDMLDADACQMWIIKATRGSRPLCPSCGGFLTVAAVGRLLDGKPATCTECGVQSSLRTGTVLEGSTLTDQQIVFLLVMLSFGVCADVIADRVGCSRATVYNWRKRLQEVA